MTEDKTRIYSRLSGAISHSEWDKPAQLAISIWMVVATFLKQQKAFSVFMTWEGAVRPTVRRFFWTTAISFRPSLHYLKVNSSYTLESELFTSLFFEDYHHCKTSSISTQVFFVVSWTQVSFCVP